MQATRQAILDYLRVHREGTVRELSREFGLTTTGIRQHLVILEGEGLVVYRDVKGRVGRPALAYRLTEEAEARYPKGYERLLVAILEAARETCSGELQARLVKAAAQRLAEPVPDAGHGTVGERAGAVATFLRSRGNVAAVEVSGSDVRVIQHTCPYSAAAKAAPVVCEMDVESLEQATGCEVHLEESVPMGADRCVFHLSKPALN